MIAKIMSLAIVAVLELGVVWTVMSFFLGYLGWGILETAVLTVVFTAIWNNLLAAMLSGFDHAS